MFFFTYIPLNSPVGPGWRKLSNVAIFNLHVLVLVKMIAASAKVIGRVRRHWLWPVTWPPKFQSIPDALPLCDSNRHNYWIAHFKGVCYKSERNWPTRSVVLSVKHNGPSLFSRDFLTWPKSKIKVSFYLQYKTNSQMSKEINGTAPFDISLSTIVSGLRSKSSIHCYSFSYHIFYLWNRTYSAQLQENFGFFRVALNHLSKVTFM